MSGPSHRAADLAQRFALQLRGDGDAILDGVATLANAEPGKLAFLANPRYRAQLAQTRAGAVVMRPADAEGYAGTALLAAGQIPSRRRRAYVRSQACSGRS